MKSKQEVETRSCSRIVGIRKAKILHCGSRRGRSGLSLPLILLLPVVLFADLFPVKERDADGYALATPGTELVFPRDHGSHPEFKTEWWYITGHLASPDDGHRYGFQITFFRSATSSSSDEQIYMAHAATIDKNAGRFLHEERLNDDRWNADAKVGELDLYNGNWYLRMLDPNTEEMLTRFSLAELGEFKLNLIPEKPKTLFGDNGYSKKSDEPGAASYYVTFTRLRVEGTANIHGKPVELSGQAWMDHEFSSSQLGEGQIGWNWTSLILKDGSELMAYVMRRSDGQVDPNSRLTLIAPDGAKTEFAGTEFAWQPIRHWTSPETGGRYPIEYQVSWKTDDGSERTIHVRPEADRQELRGKFGDFVYWEGASQAYDESGANIGQGYTELTGYTESLKGKF